MSSKRTQTSTYSQATASSSGCTSVASEEEENPQHADMGIEEYDSEGNLVWKSREEDSSDEPEEDAEAELGQ